MDYITRVDLGGVSEKTFLLQKFNPNDSGNFIEAQPLRHVDTERDSNNKILREVFHPYGPKQFIPVHKIHGIEIAENVVLKVDRDRELGDKAKREQSLASFNPIEAPEKPLTREETRARAVELLTNSGFEADEPKLGTKEKTQVRESGLKR